MAGNRTPTHKFEKGNQIAKDSNNQAKRRVRKSKLRRTEEALRKLEPKSLENIQKSVDGEEVDKESLASSKWVITNLMTVGKAAAAEEDLINGTRLKLDQATEEEEAEKDETPQSRFSLHVLPKKSDLE